MKSAPFHANGERAFRRIHQPDRVGYHCAVAKLRRRIRRWCQPGPVIGDLRVLSFRLRMQERIRAAYFRSQALF